MSRAKVYEPSGNNEAPLKYTAGMVLAVPVDADLFNVGDVTKVRLALKTPDQKVILVTPKSSDFCEKGIYIRTHLKLNKNQTAKCINESG